ncbi:hypothetical protein MATL_G00121390 [Megalops atlanticus]|uniref:Uncharacterized protein n=1 Tax=Megalops atlanticus TaxID=7932 RepID=A0A9D3T8E4_MEGAT|nr:hypothetical protein MATL_G00121390 [Megalops atlanticus]
MSRSFLRDSSSVFCREYESRTTVSVVTSSPGLSGAADGTAPGDVGWPSLLTSASNATERVQCGVAEETWQKSCSSVYSVPGTVSAERQSELCP